MGILTSCGCCDRCLPLSITLAWVPSPTLSAYQDTILTTTHTVPRLRAWRASRNISLGRYEALSSFQSDLEAGLSSDTFNIGANVSSGDSRQGLDDTAKKQVLKIMEEKGISFDEARLEYIKKKLADNQIGPDGTPLDPKAVTFGK